MHAVTWLGMAIAVAVWDWFAVALSRRRLGYFTKPAVMVALLAAVLTAAARAGRPLPMLSWVAVALFFSLLGDVFLMLPRERFAWGLAAFLLAHLAYVLAFSMDMPPFNLWTAGVAVVVGLAAGKFYERLRVALEAIDKDSLVKPIALYTAVISLMVLSALLLLWQPSVSRVAAALVAMGALLFFASDGLLAWHRFVRPLPRGRLWVRMLYHLGQVAIVVGVLALNGALGAGCTQML